MNIKYITHPQDINAHLIGEVEEPDGVHLPVVRIEEGAVLSLGCAVPSLIVLLDIGASLSVPDDIAIQCADLRVYSQVMATAGGDVKRAAAYVASEGDEAAAKLAIDLAKAKPAPTLPAKRAAKKKPAKKAAKKAKKPAKKKAAAKPKRSTARHPRKPPRGVPGSDE